MQPKNDTAKQKLNRKSDIHIIRRTHQPRTVVELGERAVAVHVQRRVGRRHRILQSATNGVDNAENNTARLSIAMGKVNANLNVCNTTLYVKLNLKHAKDAAHLKCA